MNQPEVSILIPSFNHDRFIADAVASALETESLSLEIVIVDDGSTDSTRELLSDLERDDRIRVYEQENMGAHAALNRTLDLARGEFLFILDSDDVFLPGRIPRLVDELRRHPAAALAASWIRIIDENGQELGVKEGWRNLPPWPAPTDGPYLSALGNPVLALLETNFISTTSNLAFRRSMIEKAGLRFQRLRYTHDWDFILAACHHGDLRMVPEPLIGYRVHSSNTIKEGAESGVGPMRFEIQWVVARHAHQILQRAAESEIVLDDLVRLAWNSMPTFGCDGILDRLLVLRGESETPPASFDGVIDPSHPLYRSAVETLSAAD